MMKATGVEFTCNGTAPFTDPDLLRYLADAKRAEEVAGYAKHDHALQNLNCSNPLVRNVGWMWTLTGWHRHVGMVADFYRDPDLAGFSWKEGESFARPKQ